MAILIKKLMLKRLLNTSSRNDVSARTIRNCFKKTGLIENQLTETNDIQDSDVIQESNKIQMSLEEMTV